MFLVKASTNAFSPCEGASVCQHPTVKCFANAPHLFWYRKVAYSSRKLLSMSWQKRSKRACPRSRNSGPPPNDQGRSRDAAQEVETAIHCVSDAVFAIKAGQSRLCHDRAIQGGDGVLPRVAAKQGKHHRVYSG